MSVKQQRIGIMGGTFDPIHYGHLLIAENAAAQYNLEQVIFMPTGQSPHKSAQNITKAAKRCEMIRLAIADNSRFSLSTLEVESHQVNYTYNTLEFLKKQQPEHEFYFIMGGDSLKEFESWKNPERILKAAYVLAAIRDDVDGEEFHKQVAYLNRRYCVSRIFCLSTPNVSVSSRSIRQLVQGGKTIRYMLPENVREYIDRHQLYR